MGCHLPEDSSTNEKNVMKSIDTIPQYFMRDDEDIRDYKLILDSFVDKYSLDSNLTISEVEILMPTTKTEFHIYYEKYTFEDSLGTLHYATKELYNLACKDSSNCFYILLNMYRIENFESVNEDYLTRQFISIEDAIFLNHEKFKNLYSSFDNDLQKQYRDFYY